MYDLKIVNARIVDPLNHIDMIGDIAVNDGKVARVAESIDGDAKKTIDATRKIVIPGIIDMHTHMLTLDGHPHAQRMLAMAGVCTTLDMAGPLDNIIETIPTSGAGINIAVLEAAKKGRSISCDNPDRAEQAALIEKTLERGGIGVKMMGGHYPMNLDVAANFIDEAAKQSAWIGWHAGSATNGSNIKGMRECFEASDGKFLHLAHINSYCRGQVNDVVAESLEAIELLKANPHIFCESYVSDLNGTMLTCVDGVPASKVTIACLKKKGYTADFQGLCQAIMEGNLGVCHDNGVIGELLYGKAGVKHLQDNPVCSGSFSVNPAESRFLVASAKRDDGSFVVDCFSTDGGRYPRNVIVEVGLSLVKFGAINIQEYVLKSSINGAKALNLPQKGHLGIGADADITVLDFDRQKAFATIVGGHVVMLDGQLSGKGTTIICDERGVDYLKAKGVQYVVKGPLVAEDVAKRLHL